jgi:hypothetical protein
MSDAKRVHNTDDKIRTMDITLLRARVTIVAKMEDETDINESDGLEKISVPSFNEMKGGVSVG